MTILWPIAVAVLAVLMLLAMLRIAVGPTSADRVVGLDAINTLMVAGMVLLAAIFKQVLFVDVAIVYALLSYVGSLYLARYIQAQRGVR